MNSSRSNFKSNAQFIRFLTILIFTVGIGFLSTGCVSKDDEKNLVKANFDMDMKNSKGEQVSMEEFRGKKIFFNVWATWCPPCIEEMPTIHNLYEEVGEKEVEFLMLSMDQDFEKAINFRDKYGYNFEIYQLTGPMPAMYHTKLIPTTFIINSEGYLVLQHDGMGKFDTEEFREFLRGVE